MSGIGFPVGRGSRPPATTTTPRAPGVRETPEALRPQEDAAMAVAVAAAPRTNLLRDPVTVTALPWPQTPRFTSGGGPDEEEDEDEE
jgi:hypothetical protein